MASPQARWTAAMLRALPDDGNRYEISDLTKRETP
jgi:hypothetical protein